MSNLKQWILGAADGEPIEAIVLGKPQNHVDERVDAPWAKLDHSKLNKVLTWKEAEPLVDYDFDSGYGIPGCHAVTAWTKNRIIFISQYKGSTSVESVPRHPVDHEPTMPGGW